MFADPDLVASVKFFFAEVASRAYRSGSTTETGQGLFLIEKSAYVSEIIKIKPAMPTNQIFHSNKGNQMQGITIFLFFFILNMLAQYI